MKTNKTLTIVAVLLAGTALAGARQQPRQERPHRKPAGFNGPVCDSPCIDKASLQRQVRRQRLQTHYTPRLRRGVQSRLPVRQWRGDRKRMSHRPGPRARQQGFGRFDFDRDGQLSHAEKAARRAFRNALDRKQGIQPNERLPNRRLNNRS